MDNQNKNDTDKAIIKLGNIFKIFALIATILIIALAVYLFSNAEPRQSSLQLGAWSLEIVENFYNLPATS